MEKWEYLEKLELRNIPVKIGILGQK